MKKKQQKGSLLIEMMAIIGLLTLITPIMFQQVHRRNEEIVNAQIATEMRMIKDSVSAYLEARGEKIARTPCSNSSTDCCGDAATSLWETLPDGTHGQYRNTAERMVPCELDIDEIDKFLAGSDQNTPASSILPQSLLNEYQISAFGYTIQTGCDATGHICSYRPALFAVIAEAQHAYTPQLRRKAKIAALIGSEGGVIDFGTGKIQGMQGSWSMPLEYTDFEGASGQYATAVVTFFNNISASSVLKDVRWQHLKATTVQADTIVGEQIAANSLFSVGTDTSSTAYTNCIQSQGTNDVQVSPSGTTIGSKKCQPFFEVNPDTKEVRISEARLRSGVTTTTYYCEDLKERECLAVGCTWNDTSGCTGGKKTASCTGKTQTVCNALPGCSWFPESGGSCLSCDNYNNLASPNNTLARKKFWCERGGCAWIVPETGTAYCDKEYLLDPARKSVANNMAVTNDITIASRGNRSVAGSLPNEVYLGNSVSCYYNPGGPGITCQNQQPNGDPSPLGIQCINDAGNQRGASMLFQDPVFCNTLGNLAFDNDPTILEGGATKCTDYSNQSNTDDKIKDCRSPCVVVKTNNTVSGLKCVMPSRHACSRYCRRLGNQCRNNFNGNTDRQDRCAAITRECNRQCSLQYSETDTPIAGQNATQNELSSNATLLPALRQVCYMTYGHCRFVWKKRACPDTSFTPTVKHKITNITTAMDVNPGGSLADLGTTETVATYELYGASGISFDEYCIPPKE